jgi:hypothetical protein
MRVMNAVCFAPVRSIPQINPHCKQNRIQQPVETFFNQRLSVKPLEINE